MLIPADYYRGITEADMGKSRRDGEKMQKRLENSKAYSHNILVRTLYIPKIFTDEQEDFLRSVCDTMYDIAGSLCENNDKFAVDRMLPKIEIGDIVVIHDTGAHGFSMGYNYNGKLRSAEVLLQQDGTPRLIRRAETPQDYMATLDIYPEFR